MLSVSRGVSACPARWFTPISGRPDAAAIPLAHMTPDSTPPIRPGPAVTAMASISLNVRFALIRACFTHVSSFSAWGPCGDFRHDTTKGGMQVGLTVNHRRQDIRRIVGGTDHCRRRIVTAAFQPEDGKRGAHGVCRCVLLYRQVTPEGHANNSGQRMVPTILITRPDPSGAAFADQVRRRFGDTVQIVLSPVLKIERCGSLPDLSRFRTLIFTSRHGVEAFAALSDRRDLPAYAVGDATARSAPRRRHERCRLWRGRAEPRGAHSGR